MEFTLLILKQFKIASISKISKITLKNLDYPKTVLGLLLNQ